MSHQPFESYLLADTALSQEQHNALDQHLKGCERCFAIYSALAELNTVLHYSPPPLPKPGFTQRWQNRLEVRRQTRQIRKYWGLAIGILTLAVLTMLTVFLINFPHINWYYEFTQAIARVSVVAAQIRQFSNLIGRLTNRSPFFLPIFTVFAMGIFSLIFMLMITWFGTIIRLYSPINEKGNLS